MCKKFLRIFLLFFVVFSSFSMDSTSESLRGSQKALSRVQNDSCEIEIKEGGFSTDESQSSIVSDPSDFDIENTGELKDEVDDLRKQASIQPLWKKYFSCFSGSKKYGALEEDAFEASKFHVIISGKTYPLICCFFGGLVPFAAGPCSKPGILATKLRTQVLKLKEKPVWKELAGSSLVYSASMGVGNLLFFYLDPLGLSPAVKYTLIAMAQFYLQFGLYEKQLKTEQKKAIVERTEFEEGPDFFDLKKKKKKKAKKGEEAMVASDIV